MTTEAKPSTYQRAESTARQWVLQIGLGVTGFVVGSMLSSGITARLLERLGAIENETLAEAFTVVMQRLWLLLVIPAFGWAAGRFTQLVALRFAVTACVSGEIFSLLLFTAMYGLEGLTEDPGLVASRLVTLLVGMALTVRAVAQGRMAAADAQTQADALAAKQKAELAEYLAAAEKKT